MSSEDVLQLLSKGENFRLEVKKAEREIPASVTRVILPYLRCLF